jgi:phosphate:Na+ symporter
MEQIATLLGGLGLFFLGIRQLGQNMQAMAGPRARRLVARLTQGPLAGAAAGLGLGMLTQSSSAVTFIAANMQASGMVSVARALPVLAWANLGTTMLVLLVTLDLRLAALMLLGLAGCAAYFNVDGGGRWRPVVQAMVGIGLLFLGLSLLKAGAAPLRESTLLRELLTITGDAAWPAFALGLLVTLLAQSSSTVTMLAITFFNAGALHFGEAEMAIYGASLGSGLATYLLAGGLSGTARQLVLYQVAFKTIGTALFLALHGLDLTLETPLVTGVLALLAAGQDTQLGILFALMQLVTALLVMALNRPLLRILIARAPAGATETLARTMFIYAGAARDAPSALALARCEQDRLLARLPLLLNTVREGALAPPLPVAELSASARPIEAALDSFLGNLIADATQGSLQRAAMLEAVRLQARTRLLRDLRAAVTDVALAVEAGPGTPMPQLVEALHLLLEQLAEARDAEDEATILVLTEDRGTMMRRLRETGSGDISPALLRQATSGFERAVWLVRSLLLLDQEAEAILEDALRS